MNEAGSSVIRTRIDDNSRALYGCANDDDLMKF